MFGYFVGHRGAGCSLWGVGRDLLGAECEILGLILKLQTFQIGLCFAHVVTIH